MMRIILIVLATISMIAIAAGWTTIHNLPFIGFALFFGAFLFPEDWFPLFTRKSN